MYSCIVNWSLKVAILTYFSMIFRLIAQLKTILNSYYDTEKLRQLHLTQPGK